MHPNEQMQHHKVHSNFYCSCGHNSTRHAFTFTATLNNLSSPCTSHKCWSDCQNSSSSISTE